MTQPAEYECPKCGCNDVARLRDAGTRFGQPVRRLRCGHCGHTWQHRANWPTPKADLEAGKQPEPAWAEDVEPPLEEPPAADVSPGGAVFYHVVRCPECGSAETKVTSTKRPIRRHKCRECGAPFKSVEK